MASINKAIIVGNLGQDPEVGSTKSGGKVVNLSVATSEQWRDKSSGEKKERTEWHRVVIFGHGESDGLAGIAEKYLRKGSKVYLEGKIQTRKWQDQAGVDRYSTEIVLHGFDAALVLLDGASGGSNRPPPANGPDDYGTSKSGGGGGGAGVSGAGTGGMDDIPFAPEAR